VAWVDHDGIDLPSSAPQEQKDEVAELAASLGVTPADLFNLSVRLLPDGTPERFRNVSMAEGARRVDRVLEASSSLVRVRTGMTASGRPAATPVASSGAIQWATASGGSDGQHLDWTAPDVLGSDGSSTGQKTGMYVLDNADIFNLLCIPPDRRSNESNDDVPTAVYSAALAYCVAHRALLLVDPPSLWDNPDTQSLPQPTPNVSDVGLFGPQARNAAVFYPRLIEPDPLRKGQLDEFVPCGAVAGIFAATDARRGVWKAPAGLDASLQGVSGLSVRLNDPENGLLNVQGINCLRVLPGAGPVVWGSRTLRGGDRLGDEYRYVPVRRTALFIEESLYRGTTWVVFEPNDEPLWAQIRLNVGAFMQTLFRQGAFQGATPADAYLVKCDKETTTQDDINRGVVNILVGFAPLKPAEFVVIKVQQLAGQIAA
jgi:phage tail sheath protein FI